jgi:hypothetical protein
MVRKTPYAVKVAVIALSRNRCAFPNARAFHDTELGVNVGQICHIHGIEPGRLATILACLPSGSRGVESVILCADHATVVDSKSRRHEFSADLLPKWKQAIEESDLEPPPEV